MFAKKTMSVRQFRITEYFSPKTNKDREATNDSRIIKVMQQIRPFFREMIYLYSEVYSSSAGG
jgi:hypothetical protein